MRRFMTILLIAVWTAIAGAADATVIISQGLAGGSGDVDKVRFDDPSLILQGNPVSGMTNSGILLVISSDEGLVVNLPGRATIGAMDGGFDTITVIGMDPVGYNITRALVTGINSPPTEVSYAGLDKNTFGA